MNAIVIFIMRFSLTVMKLGGMSYSLPAACCETWRLIAQFLVSLSKLYLWSRDQMQWGHKMIVNKY